MLQLPQLTDSSPWTASAALYISLTLSLMAVVTALHHTIFLNAASFQPSPDAQLRRIFGLRDGDPNMTGYDAWGKHRRRCCKTRTVLFGMSQLLLSYSIICAFVGVGLMTISPLWDRSAATWDRQQKVGYMELLLQSATTPGGPPLS
jgi:hypothetical protein